MCAEAWEPRKGELLFDRYDIIKKLGEGAWGTVYLAYDTRWDVQRPIAIKHLSPEIVRRNPRAIERFKDELKIIMNNLRGLPQVVMAYDFNNIDKINYFYIMDYVEGGSLRDLLDKQGAFPILDAIDMALDICGALEAIHGRGVIHNDLKPDNILMLEERTKRLVMISDFGSASVKGLMGEIGTRATGPRTLYYSSPELLQDKLVDERSDLYAVGGMLYEMIIGEVPFPEEGVGWFSRILNDPPIVPSSRRNSVSSALDEVILKALKKHPDERYSSADEMMNALREVRKVEAQRHEEKQELYKRGVSHFNMRIWQDAIECFDKVKTLDPNYKNVAQLLEKARRQGDLEERYARAKTLIKPTEWETAISELEEIIRIEENYRDAKALLEEAQKQHKLAELYEEAIRCEQGGEWVTARDLYLEIVNIDPEYKEVLDKVAEAAKRIKLEDIHREVDEHLLKGELDKAIRILEEILRIEPDHPKTTERLQEVKRQKEMWTYYTEGMRHFHDKRWDLAIKYFEEVAYCVPASLDEDIWGTALDSLPEEALSKVPIYVLACVRLAQAKKLQKLSIALYEGKERIVIAAVVVALVSGLAVLAVPSIAQVDVPRYVEVILGIALIGLGGFLALRFSKGEADQ